MIKPTRKAEASPLVFLEKLFKFGLLIFCTISKVPSVELSSTKMTSTSSSVLNICLIVSSITVASLYVDNMIEPLINMGYKIKIFDVKNYLCWGIPNDYKIYQYWLDYFSNI